MLKYLAFFIVIIVMPASATPAPGRDAKPASDDRAMQLFQEMEGRLAKAKTLECVYEIKVVFQEAGGGPGKPLLLEGSLFLAEGNRAREEMNERTDGRPLFKLLVSDGTRWAWHDKGSPPHSVHRRPHANLNADFLTSLARTGIFLPTLPLPPVEAVDSKDRFPVSGFQLGLKEKVGGREAQRLEYQLFVKGQNGPKGEEMPFPATVWLDLQTSLPVKRVVTQRVMGVTGLAITESYGKLMPDGKVDAKQFELPKETKDTIVEPSR